MNKPKREAPGLVKLVLLKPFRMFSTLINRLYAWAESFAESKHAEKYLFGLSFTESSFFPIPPDPLLLANVFVRPKRWIRLALITTVASVLGGMFGYLIGTLLIDTFGDWLIETYHLQEDFDNLGNAYRDGAFLAVLGAALTPIPYKIITISAGAFSVNFPLFVIASVIGRGLRFGLVSALGYYLGQKHKEKIVKYIDYVSLIVLALTVVGFIIYRSTHG